MVSTLYCVNNSVWAFDRTHGRIVRLKRLRLLDTISNNFSNYTDRKDK